MEKNKKQNFGCARAAVIIMLAILGLGFIFDRPVLGVLMIIAMFYVIFMDAINGIFEKSKKEKAAVEAIVYNPEEFGEPVSCPFCGKEVPSGVNYCYYCGKSLSAFKRIEAVRTDSLAQMDKALEEISNRTYKTKIKEVRDLTDKILRKYEEDPEDTGDYEKFIDYYLPKTVAAIEHYHILCTLDNLDLNEKKIKGQLEESFDLLTEAFTNIYNRASTEGLEDVSIDVSVLENIMKQEGLTDSDFPG